MRITPRFNPDVNGYWMCDIGRFDYHWIEGEDRLRRPLVRRESGVLEPVDWHEALAKASDRIGAAGGTDAMRFLVSAHASLEELYLLGRLGSGLGVPEDGVAISWRTREKPQPATTKFTHSGRRRTEREGRGGPRVPGRIRQTAPRTSPPSAAASSRGASRPCTSSILDRRVRSATCRGSSARAARASCRCSSCRGCC